MVGVVGSSPIEPTNETGPWRCQGLKAVRRWVYQGGRRQETPRGEYGYDTANVHRNYFGATLVEDLFRLCSLV